MRGGAFRGQAPALFACGLLAIVATSLSLAMSVVGGWNRGDTQLNSLLWSGLGILATLGAHLLPAASRLASGPIRGMAWMLWAGCFALAVFGHATYFLASQHSKGAQRAEAVRSPINEGKRSLSLVILERGELDYRISAMVRLACLPDCYDVQRKLARLRSQRSALEQEEVELRKSAARTQAYEAAVEHAQNDAGVYALANALGLRPRSVQDGLGALMGFLVDGIACLAWTLMLSFRRQTGGIPAATPKLEDQPPTVALPPVVVELSHRAPAQSVPGVATPDAKLVELVARARVAIAAGQMHPTVRALRGFLQCSQQSAVAVRRTILGSCDDDGNAALLHRSSPPLT